MAVRPIQLIHCPQPQNATIALDGSKSISNRLLLIRRLCHRPFDIEHISTSNDTKVLSQLLWSEDAILDAQDAGTTFRFITAYLCTLWTPHTLTGSDRMKERTIEVLVQALKSLGAEIKYLEKEGYPPIHINPSPDFAIEKNQVFIKGNVSSQFISALLLIAPTLPNGLRIDLILPLSSTPYIDMTIQIMQYFGANVSKEDLSIIVKKGSYVPKSYFVEGDWSAASYYYSLCALSVDLKIELIGLSKDSIQGDSILPKIYNLLGVETIFEDHKIIISKTGPAKSMIFEWDFVDCPDLAQTVSVTLAGLGITGIFCGLESLRIKETDRIEALRSELGKGGVSFSKLPPHMNSQTNKTYFIQQGLFNFSDNLVISTYKDHRMAMSFAPLALLGDIKIDDHEVVSKSYKRYWIDLQKIGIGHSYI